MAIIEVRDVPEEVWSAIVAEAQSRGESTQTYLLNLLKEIAERRGIDGLGRIR